MVLPYRSVTLGILTYQRNEELTQLLDLLGELLGNAGADCRVGWEVDVLVVDNDPCGGAKHTVEASAARAIERGSAPIRYVSEPRPGIAAARARAMAEALAAGADVLVFLDDDEEPRPGWLDALLSTWETTGAAAVAGRVVPRYPEGIHPWLVTGKFFERRNLPTGTAVEAAPTGNLLLDLVQCERLGIRFDPDLGLRGGEDNLFTRQLTAAGGLIVFCRESEVIDPIPDDRATIGWALKRVYAHASGEADIRGRLGGAHGATPIRVRGAVAGAGLLRMGGGVLQVGHGVLTRDAYRRARGVRTVVRGVGLLGGALRRPHVEYAREGE